MSNVSQQEQTRKVLTICRGRWLSSGIPENKVDEMTGELEDHLDEALAKGQSVEDATGRNVFVFAEEWAALEQPRKPVGHEVLEMFAATSAFMFVVVLAAHLWQSSASLPASWEVVGFFVGLAWAFSWLFMRVRRPAGASSDDDETMWEVYPVWLRYGLLGLGILAVTYDRFVQSPEEVAFVWPWSATAVLLMASPVLLALRKVVGGKTLEYRPGSRNDADYLYDGFDPQDEIDLVVEDCVFYWKTDTRIPADQACEMGEELEQHLWGAVEDGKTVESVIGPDVEAFAEEWADEERPPTSTRDRVVEFVFGVSAFFTIAAGLGHFLGWELYVPILWFPVLLFIGIGSSLVGKIVDQTRQPQTVSLRKSWLLAAGVALLVAVLAVGIASALFGIREAVPLLASLR